ncbi:MAG: nucleotidyl transferase AbiEii/AbiGii toxin family protein [Chloroflexi bacterium]|nr:nucleotidyl transferase AbiEii/AbiGii toxin family protein [Chloroflexota bacterium]
MQFKARIKNLALKNHVSAQSVLQNFMLERLLERISQSRYKDKFVLKGGMLIASLVGIDSRTTMDMDATVLGFPLSEESLRSALLDICSMQLSDDTTFTLDTIEPIRDDDEYGGFRAAIIARYESINTPLKFDITTGDVMTPGAVRYAFQSSFEDRVIGIWAYNIETMLAEKVETILRRGVLNTRLRDFYDVYIIAERQKINRKLFAAALNATAQHRGSLVALEDKENIMAAIREDEIMLQRWRLYSGENFYARDIEFGEIMDVLKKLI